MLRMKQTQNQKKNVNIKRKTKWEICEMSATEFLERFHTVFLSMSISHHNHNLSLCLFSTFHAHLTSELFISFCRTQL